MSLNVEDGGQQILAVVTQMQQQLQAFEAQMEAFKAQMQDVCERQDVLIRKERLFEHNHSNLKHADLRCNRS